MWNQSIIDYQLQQQQQEQSKELVVIENVNHLTNMNCFMFNSARYDAELNRLRYKKRLLNNVHLICRMKEMNETEYFFYIKFIDYTSSKPITVKYWKKRQRQTDHITDLLKSINSNHFHHIYGACQSTVDYNEKSSQSHNIILLFSIIPIKSFNELTLHPIEIIYQFKILSNDKSKVSSTNQNEESIYLFSKNNQSLLSDSSTVIPLTDSQTMDDPIISNILTSIHSKKSIKVDDLNSILIDYDEQSIKKSIQLLIDNEKIEFDKETHSYRMKK
ncbi:hypothetical protein SNEBB_010458 [Seison nebaliae]|nr:hypothetical protein SNEBB_010458 [Seison nebaliae]